MVSFDTEEGPSCVIPNDATMVETAIGKVRADTLQVGDKVRVNGKMPLLTVSTVPVIS